MAEKTYGQRALTAVTAVAGLIIAFSGAASAAPAAQRAQQRCEPQLRGKLFGGPSSGVLFFKEHGVHLGEEAGKGKLAPHGGQRGWVQGALQKSC
jgi:hypothetical protein